MKASFALDQPPVSLMRVLFSSCASVCESLLLACDAVFVLCFFDRLPISTAISPPIRNQNSHDSRGKRNHGSKRGAPNSKGTDQEEQGLPRKRD